MKILIVSKFLHYVGGVETYVRWLAKSLADQGISVGMLGMAPPAGHDLMDLPDGPKWFTPPRSYEPGSPGRIKSAALSVWSRSSTHAVTSALRDFSPDLVHFHGTCYQLTPAVVKPVGVSRVPAILTAHEYKLICANQTLYDDASNTICTACVGASPLDKLRNPIQRRCMKGSLSVSALGAIEGRFAERVWRQTDPLILTPSHFMREQLVTDGWPAARIEYLDLPWIRGDRSVSRADAQGPNHPQSEQLDGRQNIVFLGRLAPIKGADRLIRAWGAVASQHPKTRLRVIGKGAQQASLEAEVTRCGVPRVDFLGHCERPQIDVELAHARVTVHPSQCHENSPYSVRESLMAGVPAIVSRVGGMPEMVSQATGWVVPHNDDLAWRDALSTALLSRISGSRDLDEAVVTRAVTDIDHRLALMEAYHREIKRKSRDVLRVHDSSRKRRRDKGVRG